MSEFKIGDQVTIPMEYAAPGFSDGTIFELSDGGAYIRYWCDDCQENDEMFIESRLLEHAETKS